MNLTRILNLSLFLSLYGNGKKHTYLKTQWLMVKPYKQYLQTKINCQIFSYFGII